MLILIIKRSIINFRRAKRKRARSCEFMRDREISKTLNAPLADQMEWEGEEERRQRGGGGSCESRISIVK